MSTRRISAAALAATVLTIAVLARVHTGPTPVTTDVDPSDVSPSPIVTVDVPRPLVTPGMVLTTSTGDVCTPGWSAAHRRSLSAAERRSVLGAYQLPADARPAEWDHLISLELGGGNGPLNVWPEMTVAGKHRKDALENRLHASVCRGALSLAEAQHEVVNFWHYW